MDDTVKYKGHGLIELNHSQFAEAPEITIQQLTKQWLSFVMAADATNDVSIKDLREGLYQLGQSEQHAFWELNNRLKHPLEKLIRDVEGGEKLTQHLRQLQVAVLKIKPPKRSFLGRFVNMFKLLFSLKESAWHIWLEDYPGYKQQILKITEDLEALKRQLKRDNSLFLSDKDTLHSHMLMLESSFDMVCFLEKKVSHETAHNQEISTDTKQLLLDELLPTMQERLIELQQQLLIARQSVMTMDLFIIQNESQIRAIDQAIYTTTTAIEVTASIFMLKQTGGLKEQSDHKSNTQTNLSAKQKYQAINGVVDAQRLKQARQLIDKALDQMEEAKAKPMSILESTESLKNNSNSD